jgi:tRNA nucleotidyltransferase (CCA-adding enzyme)
MDTFSIKPCKEVGILKESIKNAILDGIIKKSYEDAKEYMLNKYKEIVLIEK